MAVKLSDAKQNEAVAKIIISDYPKEISGAVGIHALGKLTELMPHEEFVQFAEDALHHATTGQVPPTEPQQPQQPQPTGAPQ